MKICFLAFARPSSLARTESVYAGGEGFLCVISRFNVFVLFPCGADGECGGSDRLV